MDNHKEKGDGRSFNACDRDAELKRLNQITEFFSNKDIKAKTDIDYNQRRDLSILRGYSAMIGGLPGVDETLNIFDEYGPSLNRKSRLEFVDIMKPGNTNLLPSHYPLPPTMDGKPKTIIQRVLGQ
jgi:hypothetical protein